MNHTTECFARQSRPSGTEYAASIERYRRRDWSGIYIVAGLIFAPQLLIWWLLILGLLP